MTRRLGFDAVRALRNRSGLGQYSRSLLRALSQHGPHNSITLYSSRSARPEYSGFATEIGARLCQPTMGALRAAWWRTMQLGRVAARDEMALFHGLSHEIPRDLPRTGVKSVVTFHDLIYEEHPELFGAFDRASYRWRYRWSARNADAIIAVSRHTKRALVQRYGINAGRIAVVPPIVNPVFATPVSPGMRAEVRARHALPPQYLLAVGTMEARKNHRLLLRALSIDPALGPLVIVGRDGGEERALRAEAQRLRLGDRLRIVTDVGDDDLAAAVQGASVALYPSRIEGFGMPIVEALSAGVPSVAASGGHLADAGGVATLYASPDSPEEWATAIRSMQDDSSGRAARIAAGTAHAARFAAAALAARLVAVYDAVCGGNALPDDPAPDEATVEQAR